MGKRPGSRQRELRLAPQAMARSEKDSAERAGHVQHRGSGLLGALLGRLGTPAAGVLVDQAKAEKTLQDRYAAFERAPEGGES